MHKPKGQPFYRTAPGDDVASTRIRVFPWAAPAVHTGGFSSGETAVSLTEGLRHVIGPRTRVRARKPGDIHRNGPCELEARVDEHLDYHESACERFVNGVGKSYEGYRMAHTEDEGFVRIENDGSETAPSQSDIARFRKDLSEAARTDGRIAAYIAEKGIA